MARQSSGNWRVTCGRTRTFYVKYQPQGAGYWLVGASADSRAKLAAAVARVQARYPQSAIRVTDAQGAVVDAAVAARAA